MAKPNSKMWRVVYTSKVKASLIQDPLKLSGEINEILETARSHNQQHGISGVLYYFRGCFYQCLEGSKSEVDKLMNRIRVDDRHENVRVVIDEPIEDRLFSLWSLRYVEMMPEVRHYLISHGIESDLCQMNTEQAQSVLSQFTAPKIDQGQPLASLLNATDTEQDWGEYKANKPFIWFFLALGLTTLLLFWLI